MSEFAYIVDDEEAVRVSLRALLGTRGDRIVTGFASAEAFLADIGEREVLMLLVDGASNRDMAEQMGLSVRTVEVHRANLMAKLNAPSLPAAIHLVHAAGLIDAPALAD